MIVVPDSIGGVTMLDAVGDRLRIAHTASCDSGQPRSVLSLFDPVTREEEPLVALGRRQAWAAGPDLGRAATLGVLRPGTPGPGRVLGSARRERRLVHRAA